MYNLVAVRVLVTGIFDLVHVEHVRFLASAKNLSHKSEIINHIESFRAKRSGVEESRPPAAADLDRPAGAGLDPSATLGMTREAVWDDESYLIVGIESDARVKKLKGEGRPMMGQADRKEILEGLKMVDEVMILPEDFDNDRAYEKLLKDLRVDIYAVSENSPFMENKRKICDRAGVVLKVVCRYNPEYSTTKLIEKLLNC